MEKRTCSGGFGAVQGFDQDGFSELFADAKPGVANLTNQAGLLAEKLDDLPFAEAEFTQTVPNFRAAGEFLDANDRARFDVAQRADRGPGAFAVHDHARLRFLVFAHWCQNTVNGVLVQGTLILRLDANCANWRELRPDFLTSDCR